MFASPRTPPILDPPIRLAVCVSGGGTTLQNLIERIESGELAASIVQVIASRPDIDAIPRARRAGIPVDVVHAQTLARDAFSTAVFDAIRLRGADLVVLGGFLNILSIPPDFEHRVINIHPALIPAFCGKGFHGEKVHRAVLDRGVKISGCTVHFADNHYDHGPIILQRPVPVLDGDTPATLAARVFDAECDALPDAIALYAAGQLAIDGARVLISPRHHHASLH
jgi:formyltetrahydrofolate-dependent phosphoribosylglycinamide formyltransferase